MIKRRIVIASCFVAFVVCIFIFLFIKKQGAYNVASPKESENVVEMIPGQELQINKDVGNAVWKSEDKEIATVTKDGVIRAKKTGKVAITAKIDNATYKYVVEVKQQDSTEKSNQKEVSEEETSDDLDDEDKVEINDTLPILVVNSVEVVPGDKNVKITIDVKNNPGILGMSFAINYDESIAKLTKVESGTALENILTFTPAKKLSAGCSFVWDGTEIQTDQIKDGTILVLYFDIVENANEGKYSVDISYEDGNIVDYKLIPINMNVQNGKIYIKNKGGQ